MTNLKLTLGMEIEIDRAFSARRTELFTSWMLDCESSRFDSSWASDVERKRMLVWAQRIENCNDAQRIMRGAIDAGKIEHARQHGGATVQEVEG